MHFFCSAVIQKFRSLTKLGSPDDGIIDKQQRLATDKRINRYELHVSYEISHTLIGRHEGSGPCRSVFDKWSRKGNSRSVCVADCMSDSRVRSTRNYIRLHIIPPGQHCATVITHLFDIYTLVGRCRVAVVYP